MVRAPPSASRSARGQSTIGGSAAVAGRPSRIAAVGIKSPRLDDRVREVRRADHHRLHLRGGDAAVASSARSADDDPAGHVRRRRRLRLGEHVAPVHEHGVRVRAADVDADAHCSLFLEPVQLFCPLGREDTVRDVFPDRVRVALGRRAVAAAGRRDELEAIAGLRRAVRELRRHLDAVSPSA